MPPQFSCHGSPPRAWGRRFKVSGIEDEVRFTPTSVGKTNTFIAVITFQTVHPHERGEDLMSASVLSSALGSPPRAWGRLLLAESLPITFRFTPTSVGKTRSPWWEARLAAVHPHERGEDSRANAPASMPSGSPPRAWGRPAPVGRVAPGRRFTPTSVGKTPRHYRGIRERAVHPHERGEDYVGLYTYLSLFGSPPRAWGRLICCARHAACLRFTPTSVGKTSARHPSCKKPAVHPHERGEDTNIYTRTPSHLLQGCGFGSY